MRLHRRRRRRRTPEPSPPLTAEYALCPVGDCERLVDRWEVNSTLREVHEVEPLWPGGPLVAAPGMIARQEYESHTATWHPCGHSITWAPGEDAFAVHSIVVPLDMPRNEVMRRLLDARLADAADRRLPHLRS